MCGDSEPGEDNLAASGLLVLGAFFLCLGCQMSAWMETAVQCIQWPLACNHSTSGPLGSMSTFLAFLQDLNKLYIYLYIYVYIYIYKFKTRTQLNQSILLSSLGPPMLITLVSGSLRLRPLPRSLGKHLPTRALLQVPEPSCRPPWLTPGNCFRLTSPPLSQLQLVGFGPGPRTPKKERAVEPGVA